MIKGPKSFENLNPVLVMGKTAFTCFLKEWIEMCKKNNINYWVKIETKKYYYKEDAESYLEIDSVKIVNLIGFAIYVGEGDDGLLTISPSLWRNFSALKENWDFSDNILVDFIINPDSEKIKEKDINRKIIVQTQKMIIERSALLKKDFFSANKYLL